MFGLKTQVKSNSKTRILLFHERVRPSEIEKWAENSIVYMYRLQYSTIMKCLQNFLKLKPIFFVSFVKIID